MEEKITKREISKIGDEEEGERRRGDEIPVYDIDYHSSLSLSLLIKLENQVINVPLV